MNPLFEIERGLVCLFSFDNIYYISLPIVVWLTIQKYENFENQMRTTKKFLL